MSSGVWISIIGAVAFIIFMIWVKRETDREFGKAKKN